MKRVWKQFTTYNQIACVTVFLFKENLFHWIVEIVRGMATLVALGVAIVYFINGYSMIEALYVKLHHDKIPRWLIPVWDFANHFLPLILVGFPKTWWGLSIAYVILVAWFMAFRNKLERIYIKGIEFDKVMWILTFLVICFNLMALSKTQQNTHNYINPHYT
jgi:hypothetical protein